jgi:hypothetical protein
VKEQATETPVTARLTVPEKGPLGATVIMEVPATVANVVTDVGFADTTNPGPIVTVIPAAPLTSLNSVEAEAAVPLTVTTKLVTVGSGLQLTEIRPAVLTVAVQPAG